MAAREPIGDTVNGHHHHDTAVQDKAAYNANAGGRPHQQYASLVPDPTGRRANPGPLGLIGFALTTFVLGLYQCGAGLPGSNPQSGVGPDQAVVGLAIFMGGFAQFVAGIFEFICANSLGTTIHCSYGAFWLSFSLFLIPSVGIQSAYKNDTRAYSFHIGIYLLLWCFLTIIFLLAALRTNWAIISVLFFLVLAFFFLSLAQFTSTEHPHASVGLNKTGGAFSVICAFLAFYAGAAGLMVPDTTPVRLPLGVIAYKGANTASNV